MLYYSDWFVTCVYFTLMPNLRWLKLTCSLQHVLEHNSVICIDITFSLYYLWNVNCIIVNVDFDYSKDDICFEREMAWNTNVVYSKISVNVQYCKYCCLCFRNKWCMFTIMYLIFQTYFLNQKHMKLLMTIDFKPYFCYTLI